MPGSARGSACVGGGQAPLLPGWGLRPLGSWTSGPQNCQRLISFVRTALGHAYNSIPGTEQGHP